jgi:hypothetical protein
MQSNMSVRIVLLALLLWLICSTLVGCKEGPAGPQGPPGSTLSGDLSGFAFLLDYNLRQLTDHSGILVQLEGSQIQTTTSANGKWILANIPTGTYTIKFSKSGYGTLKEISYQFVGGGRVFLGSRYLNQVAPYYVSNLTASVAFGTVLLSGNYTGTLPLYPKGMFFVGTTSSVSSDPSTYLGASFSYAFFGDTLFYAQIDSSAFHYWGLQAGTTAYLVAYGGYSWESKYPDTATGRYYYTALNPTRSNVVSVVVP